tara:strand:+ start:331 stop:963 length:633 start_codon:yes stop_codon:yes gene_type:complete
MKSNYYNKYKNIIPKHFFEKENIKILEFGVETGQTTSLFLEICETNKGSVFSVDCENYSKLFESPNWTFINLRDDNFAEIETIIKNITFDIICLDTIHTKKHIKKILEFYFKYLKVGGIFIVDGISHLPYIKNNYRDNFYSEINNKEIFDFLLSLKNNSENKILLDVSFEGSGVARITKLENLNLKQKKLISRIFTLKNFLRKFYLYFFK